MLGHITRTTKLPTLDVPSRKAKRKAGTWEINGLGLFLVQDRSSRCCFFWNHLIWQMFRLLSFVFFHLGVLPCSFVKGYLFLL